MDAMTDNRRVEGSGLAIFHELLEQPPDLFNKRWASSDGETSTVL